LLQRVFGFEVLVCDRCGGPRRILGAVTAPAAVRRVLVALGLGAQPPPRPAAPPAWSRLAHRPTPAPPRLSVC
jgi:hypothetical protein